MSELTTEQVLLLNQLMYMDNKPSSKTKTPSPLDSVTMHQGQTVGEWVNSIDTTQFVDSEDYGSYMTGKDWKNIIEAIKNDPTICDMTVATTHTDWADGGGGGVSAVFTSDSAGEAVVAFRGTANGEWKDNFTGGNVEVTAQQRNALEWYQEAYQECGLDNYEVTVTGHSKGGNKSKFIAIMDGTVDNCVSFDGQGFSDKFMEAYKDLIAANQHKIHNHNVDGDYVNILLNDVGETTFYKGYDLGEGGFLENHCPNTYMKFGENGEWTMTVSPDGQSPAMRELNDFFNAYLRSMPDGKRDAALELVNMLVDNGLSLNSDMTKQEIADTFIPTLMKTKYADDLAYLLAFTIKYEQENPGFAETMRDFLRQSGMESYADTLDIVVSVLDFHADVGPIHIDFDTALAVLLGIAGETLIKLGPLGTGGLLLLLCEWIRSKTGISIPPELLLRLLTILSIVAYDLPRIEIPSDRGDIRVPSSGGAGKQIVCDTAGLQRVENELRSIRDSLEQTAKSLGDAAGGTPYQFVAAAFIRASIRRSASSIETLAGSAGQLSAALGELAELYRRTEERAAAAGK